MSKLNQILAVEKNKKSTANKALDESYKLIQKPDLFSGLARAYSPRNEEDLALPPERTAVQVRVPDLVDDLIDRLGNWFDVTAIKDITNCDARADIVVEDVVLLADVPVTYLLFLEKQLTDLHTFVGKIPVLDPAQVWHFDANTNAYATAPSETIKTKKVPRNHIISPATDKHPAQVQVYNEDEVVGTWSTIKFSGALPAQKVQQMLNRVDALRDAVKFAREQANEREIIEVAVGTLVLNFIFAPVQELG